MSKKLFGKFFVFLLVVGLLFAVAPTGQAQAAAVVTTEAGLREALADPSVTQIELGASFALSATVDVNRSVSIDGKNFTITGPVQGTEIWQGHGLDVTANDVTISNLTITGSGRSNLVFYNVTGGLVTNVTLSNAAHAGMIVNSSTVTISHVTTTNNTWGGINVDQGSGLTTTPLLIVQNVTRHTSPTAGVTPAIWVDKGNPAWVTVGDLYTVVTPPNGFLVFYDNTEFATIAANFPIHNENLDIYYATIQDAINAATPGNTITVIGTHVLTSVVNLNKAVTLTCATGAKIQVSGTGDRFDVSAAATIQNCEIEKTDEVGQQDIIRLRASGISIKNNKIWGLWDKADSYVSRAMVINTGGFSDILITGNEIYGLRQPAYISGTHTGTISNNYVHGTKGWVLEGGNLTFTGNTWANNVGDIAILTQVPAGFYTDIVAMSAANNGAVIEDQRMSPPLLSVVYVDDSAAAGGNGTQATPYQTIQAGINRVISGGTVHVAAGAYTENVTINKSLTLMGAGDDVVTVTGVNPTTDAGMLNIAASDVTIDGFKFVGAGYKTVRITQPTSNVTFSNNYVVGAEYTSGGGWILLETNYGVAQTNLTITGNTFENNGSQIGVYINPTHPSLEVSSNTFLGDSTSGPVLGIDQMDGNEVITGNNFTDITSPYALFEGFGTVPIVDIFNDNTWPAGYIASGKSVVPASVVYPSTNDINRTNGWAHVDFVSADATARTMTFNFIQPRAMASCVEYRTNTQTTPTDTRPNYNPEILDGMWTFKCLYAVGSTPITITLDSAATFVEFRLSFGGEKDERFYWTPFTFVPEVWVDDGFTSETPGWGVDHFAVIQDGIDAVAEGGIVNVAAGTYEGPLTIEKQLSLLGPNATINPNTAVRNPEAIVVYPATQTTDADLVTVTADGVLIDGFTIDGKDLDAELWGEGVFAEANNLSVKNNIIKNFMQIGIRIYSNIAGPYYSGALIENNKVISDVTDRYFTYSGIYLQGTHGVVRGNVVDSAYRGIQIQPYNHPSTELGIVENNTFSAYKSPIYFNYSVSPTSNWIFRYNIANGIASLETDPVAYFSGIEVQTFQGGNVVFEKNQINLGTANGTINYLYKETGEVGGTSSATPNWWGSELGPQTEVSGTADFSPWCANAGCTTFLPDDDGKVTISGNPFTQTGAIKLYVDGVNYYLPAGTTIQNSSPCFEVYADDVHIYTDNPAAAKCMPTGESDGIWVADGVQNLRVVNLEFDGTDQTTGDGIHFAGVVTNFQIINNYFHDLGGSAIEFVSAPAGTIQDVYGNYFVGTNRITLGAGTLNAAYNSWGTYAAPTGLTGVNVAPHTHAEIYVTPADGGEVLKDTEVVFTVYGKIQSLTGAQFELSYPTAQLQLVSAVANEETWDQYAAVDTSVAGKITVALSAYDAVSGEAVEMLTLTFKALAYADDLTLTFSDTADVFSMYPLPEPNYSNYVYTFAQTGVTNLDIIGLPLVTITMDPAPYYAGIPIPFEVEVDNTNGGTYTGLTFDITLPALSVLEYYNGTNWVAATLPFAVGELDPDEILTFEFRVTFDQPGSNTIVIYLMNGTESIGSDSVTITIAGNFNVLGTFAMQGRTVRDDIPVTFTLGGYGPTFMSVDQLLNNLSGTLQYGGTYLITTNQARYLNVTADLLKDIDVYADVTLPSLTLRAGNAVWTGHATSNNQIDLADANQIGTDWGKPGSESLIINYGDVNFDNIVNIQDLALVGGNYELTNGDAYETWLP